MELLAKAIQTPIKQAQESIHQFLVKGRKSLTADEKLLFDIYQARVLEHDQKRIQAAFIYYQLSISLNSNELLEKAVLNTLLCIASPRKYALLTTLCRDHRAQRLPVHMFMLKHLKHNIITPKEIKEFTDKYGVSNDEVAFLEHNIVSIAKIYSNMSLECLCRLLNRDYKYVCELLETMISNTRLEAHIDQVDGYIYFKVEQTNNVEHFCASLYNVAQKV